MDTNIFVGAVMSAEGSNRRVLRRCLQGTDVPLLAQALFTEYRSILARDEVFESAPIPHAEREALFDAFCATAEWVTPYFLWRPNLPDESDNHLLELAAAGRASWVVTWNVRDLKRGELAFPDLQIADPIEYLAAVDREGV